MSRRRWYGLAVSAVITSLYIAPASALAASRSIAQLRRALEHLETTVHLERNHLTSGSGVCSATTAQGQIALIEMMRGQDRYLPSTTCEQAVSETQQEFTAGGSQECLIGEEREPFIKSAIVRLKGKRATVQLVEDFACQAGENLVNGAAAVGKLVRGAAAVRADPIGVSHWIKRRGRWLFNNEPTGTYSPAGMKAAAQLRAAMSGGVIAERSGTVGYAVAFCVNGSSHLDFLGHLLPEGGAWYVAGGLSVTYAAEPPFDPQGNPQGAVFLYQPAVSEWDITLVGDRIVASASMVQPVFEPGAAGC